MAVAALGAAVVTGTVTGYAAVTVTVDNSVEYQTVLGWGASSWSPPWPTKALKEEVMREAVNDLGLTRLRLEGPSGNRSNNRRWEWLNDNGDPEEINWAAFNTARLDEQVVEMVIPFKQRVEANGDPFNTYVSPSFFDGGSSGEVPPWMFHSPGEYAEFASAFLLYLKSAHGIEADYYCILNEAGNNNPFSASVVGRMIKALGPRLQTLGLRTKIQFPECVNADTSWNYIQALQDDAEVWRYVGAISYHLYGGNSARPNIRDFAVSRGLPTGQTEYMGLTMDHLYDDLTQGGVSYWEIYGIGSQVTWNYNRFSREGKYWSFRQVMHYVRPGAVRIGCTSDDASLRTLAFVKDEKTTVVLINGSGSRAVNVRNLPAGTYGVCQSVSDAAYEELGLRTVTSKSSLSVNVPSNTVMTVYPHPGANQPPTFTNWRAGSDYLTMPASSTTLSASATDPELDTLSYAWSVKSQVAGAYPVLARPDAASTSVTGLTVAGEYVFCVSVSDGGPDDDVVTRDVRVTVFAENQPPLPDDVHNRLPVMLTLPTSSTSLRGYAWDLEGDPLTYEWSVASQPGGAKASLANATTTNCTASNLTVPGEYVFRFEARDPTHVVAEELTVPVYPVNATAPFIKGATASPATLTLPATSRTFLSATTGDRDGDVISHWWSVQSAPAGAAPVFSDRGHAETNATHLTVPGTYVFTLTVVDRTRYTTADVTVNVGGQAATPTVTSCGIGPGNAVSLAWTDFASAYTVEAAGDLALADWQVVDPIDQWPVMNTAWMGSDASGFARMFYRVRGE
jgi:O-glycosyl hydrolase